MIKGNRSRNGWIEWLRFAAAVGIAAYHFEWIYLHHTVFLTHAYLLVEFFFCLSGYFLAKRQQKEETAMDSLPYVWAEAKKLYPLYFAAFLVCFVKECAGSPFGTILSELWGAKWELLMMCEWGFAGGGSAFNQGGAPEYISAMLLASLVLCWMLRCHKKLFANLAGPLFVLLGYSHILALGGNLSQWRAADGWVCLGVVRALAGMSAGALACLFAQSGFAAKSGRKKLVPIAISFVFLGWMIYGQGIQYYDTVLCVPVYAFLLAALDTWPRPAESSLWDRAERIGCAAGRLSYPVFLFHWPVLALLSNCLPDRNPWKVFVLFAALILAVAWLVLQLQTALQKAIKLRSR